MDYEDIIKLQEESPVYSTGNNSHNLKQCMAAFYDNDSELERRDHAEFMHHENHISFEQAIDFVQNYVDIVDTPLEDILHCFERLQCGQDLDRNTLRKKILKRKQMLKRYRAKNRQPKMVLPYEQFPELTGGQLVETEAEIKKKRNRVSAQISRDRKKQYFKELQLKNQKLQEEIIRTRLENEKLKTQCQNGTEPQRSKIQSETFNNKLTKLLIFLGVICLIGMLKETFFSSMEGLGKWKTGQKLGQFPGLDAKLISQQGVAKVAEFLEDEQVGRQLLGRSEPQTLDACRFEGTQRNSPDCEQLAHLMQKLDQIKTQISHQ